MDGDTISLTDVLRVVDDFEPFEPAGVSAGLIAWELHELEAEVAPMLEVASDQGLLERAGVEGRSGQPLWRLTEQGRETVSTR
jgi:hypothetical protein